MKGAEAYGKAADNKIFAQLLVNRITQNHPELYWAGIHAPPPGATDYRIIASTMDLIGKQSDPNDMDAGRHGVSLISPNAPKSKLGVMLPLKDASGKIIGSLGMAFKYHEGDDQPALYARATAIRDEVAKAIPDLAALFQATP